jgi:tetratricopeptide (TPR) repeat protein
VRAGGYYAGLADGISATLGGLDSIALQSYDVALGWSPDDPLALAFRGHSHVRSGNLDKARADYERALAIDPTLAAAWFGRGVVKQRTADPSGGSADIAEATRLLPGIATAMTELGVEPGVEPRAPVPGAGVPDAKGSAPVSIKPSQLDTAAPPPAGGAAAMDPVSLVERGLAFQQQGDIERAIQDYTRALELDPQYALAYYDRGTAYQQRRELGLAIADYSWAVALDPGLTDGFYNRGLAYLASGQAELALADLTRVLGSDPRYLGALQSRGVVYLLLGSYQRAIADFNAALALQAADPWSLFGRGVALQMAGDLAAGDADIAAARRLQADIAAVMAAYGVTPRRQP